MGCSTFNRMTVALNSHPCRAPWHRVLGDVAEGAGVVGAEPARPGECVVQVVMSQMPCLICSCPVSFLVKSDERRGHAAAAITGSQRLRMLLSLRNLRMCCIGLTGAVSIILLS